MSRRALRALARGALSSASRARGTSAAAASGAALPPVTSAPATTTTPTPAAPPPALITQSSAVFPRPYVLPTRLDRGVDILHDPVFNKARVACRALRCACMYTPCDARLRRSHKRSFLACAFAPHCVPI
jgi:hypothetical protein